MKVNKKEIIKTKILQNQSIIQIADIVAEGISKQYAIQYLLIASMVGLDNRATMDIDTTIRNYHLSLEDARKMIEDIIAIPLDDGTRFAIKGVENIMDEAEYPGIRFKLEATLDTMKTPLKVDISTEDVITPQEVNYEYRLMFEERSIPLLAYNLETVLSEKIETIISRGTLNTMMRDYYDLMILNIVKSDAINYADLAKALEATSRKRNSYEIRYRNEY